MRYKFSMINYASIVKTGLLFLIIFIFSGCMYTQIPKSSPKTPANQRQTTVRETGAKKDSAKLWEESMEQGRKYEREGDLKKAERFYKQELERLKDMRARKTEQYLKRVIEKREKAEKLYEEAKLLQREENFEAARIKLHHVLDLWPGHPRASNRLAMIEEHIKIHHRSKDVIHVVKKGESLSVLSEYYYGTIKKYDTVSKVSEFNGISPNSIRPGQRIIFPVIERENGALLLPRQPDGEEGSDT